MFTILILERIQSTLKRKLIKHGDLLYFLKAIKHNIYVTKINYALPKFKILSSNYIVYLKVKTENKQNTH